MRISHHLRPYIAAQTPLYLWIVLVYCLRAPPSMTLDWPRNECVRAVVDSEWMPLIQVAKRTHICMPVFHSYSDSVAEYWWRRRRLNGWTRAKVNCGLDTLVLPLDARVHAFDVYISAAVRHSVSPAVRKHFTSARTWISAAMRNVLDARFCERPVEFLWCVLSAKRMGFRLRCDEFSVQPWRMSTRNNWKYMSLNIWPNFDSVDFSIQVSIIAKKTHIDRHPLFTFHFTSHLGDSSTYRFAPTDLSVFHKWIGIYRNAGKRPSLACRWVGVAILS